MPRSLKLVACFLIVVVIAAPLVAQIAPLETPSSSAGCDEHSGPQPTHPASYSCCQGGHDTAALQRAFSLRYSPAPVSSKSGSLILIPNLSEPAVAALSGSFGSPPSFLNLRI
jgi:hypothetical protein